MYIAYERNQREIFLVHTGQTGGIYPFGDRSWTYDEPMNFKPTWLVRVSDMQVVPGSSVTEQYWTLSYSWNQSGRIILKDDKSSERYDDGEHQIITYQSIKISDFVEDIDSSVKSTRFVKFEALIHQICTDFGIQYIWYDQMCIDQDNHDAKVREIRQMHRIYKNAICTLALMPELEAIRSTETEYYSRANIDVIPTSEWSKRMWTLEEAYMSRDILFVGRNVHFHISETRYLAISSKIAHITFLEHIWLSKGEKWWACTALWFSRARISSKAHDRIFALVNIFPELKNGITFSYEQPVHDLMLQFYGLLAQNDLSILLFGVPNDPLDAGEEISRIRQEEASMLPSWTGINGVHIPQYKVEKDSSEAYVSYTIDRECMSLTSEFILCQIEAAASVKRPNVSWEDRYMFTDDGLPRSMVPESFIALSKTKDMTFVTTTKESQDEFNKHMYFNGLKATHFMPLKVENGKAVNTLSRPTAIGGLLSLTEDCFECIILLGIRFKLYDSFHCYTVIKKDNNHYRSIGLCLLDADLDVTSSIQPYQTFRIQ